MGDLRLYCIVIRWRVCVLFQLYCAQWLGEDNILCGGTANNLVRIVNRHSLEVTLSTICYEQM